MEELGYGTMIKLLLREMSVKQNYSQKGAHTPNANNPRYHEECQRYIK